jgi:hypothetical protein
MANGMETDLRIPFSSGREAEIVYNSLRVEVEPARSKVGFRAVFRIRIHRIHMFLGLPDTDPDTLVRGMDPAPDPDPSIVMQNSKKKPCFRLFCDSF